MNDAYVSYGEFLARFPRIRPRMYGGRPENWQRQETRRKVLAALARSGRVYTYYHDTVDGQYLQTYIYVAPKN